MLPVSQSYVLKYESFELRGELCGYVKQSRKTSRHFTNDSQKETTTHCKVEMLKPFFSVLRHIDMVPIISNQTSTPVEWDFQETKRISASIKNLAKAFRSCKS